MRKEKIVASVEVESFAHATEDQRRVIQALLNVMPEDVRRRFDRKAILYNTLQGHYGNPITYYRFRLEREEAQRVAEYLLKSFDDTDSELILSSLENRSDGSSLYLRIDKQYAYLGKIRLLQGDDVIRIKISFLPHIRGYERIRDAVRQLGLKG